MLKVNGPLAAEMRPAGRSRLGLIPWPVFMPRRPAVSRPGNVGGRPGRRAGSRPGRRTRSPRCRAGSILARGGQPRCGRRRGPGRQPLGTVGGAGTSGGSPGGALKHRRSTPVRRWLGNRPGSSGPGGGRSDAVGPGGAAPPAFPARAASRMGDPPRGRGPRKVPAAFGGDQFGQVGMHDITPVLKRAHPSGQPPRVRSEPSRFSCRYVGVLRTLGRHGRAGRHPKVDMRGGNLSPRTPARKCCQQGRRRAGYVDG